ncbi:17840_t:CDS:2, partial [Gigaspora rosea]
ELEVISSSSNELEAISHGSDKLEAISHSSDKLEVISSSSNKSEVISSSSDELELSYMAGDAIFKFIKKYGQVSTKALSRSTKDGLLFLNTLKKDYTKFLSTPIVQIKDQ